MHMGKDHGMAYLPTTNTHWHFLDPIGVLYTVWGNSKFPLPNNYRCILSSVYYVLLNTADTALSGTGDLVQY